MTNQNMTTLQAAVPVVTGDKLLMRQINAATPTSDSAVPVEMLATYFAGNQVQLVYKTTTPINAFTVANTALYTVPAGKSFICTEVTIRVAAANAVTSGPALGIGNIAGTNNIFASATLSTLTTTTSIFGFQLVGASVLTTAGGTVYLNLGTAATGTSETINIDVLGYLV